MGWLDKLEIKPTPPAKLGLPFKLLKKTFPGWVVGGGWLDKLEIKPTQPAKLGLG